LETSRSPQSMNRYPEFDLVTENLRRDSRRMGRYEEIVVQG
jgi:hypothetical protein